MDEDRDKGKVVPFDEVREKIIDKKARELWNRGGPVLPASEMIEFLLNMKSEEERQAEEREAETEENVGD